MRPRRFARRACRVLMAPLAALFGHDAIFWLTPIAAASWCSSAFAIGRQLAGGMAGATAAILTATSPIVLYQTVQPMNDILTAALWLGAIAIGGERAGLGRADRPRDPRPPQSCAARRRPRGDSVHPVRHQREQSRARPARNDCRIAARRAGAAVAESRALWQRDRLRLRRCVRAVQPRDTSNREPDELRRARLSRPSTSSRASACWRRWSSTGSSAGERCCCSRLRPLRLRSTSCISRFRNGGTSGFSSRRSWCC